MKLKSLALSALAVSLSIGATAPAFAGLNAVPTTPATCTFYGGDEGTICIGTFSGIRTQTADGDASVEFGINSDPTLWFVAKLKGKTYSCTAPAKMKDLWMAAYSGTGFFFIQYDLLGRCIFAMIKGGSQYKNANAL